MENYSKKIELKGHIIDSFTLPKVYDEILSKGGNYSSEEIKIGKTKKDASYARIVVTAPSKKLLKSIIDRIHELGAIVKGDEEIMLKVAKKNGVFPEGFYSTTNLNANIFYKNRWIAVEDVSMDCGIKVDTNHMRAKCLKMIDVQKGDKFVVDLKGVQVILPDQPKKRGVFEFIAAEFPQKNQRGF